MTTYYIDSVHGSDKNSGTSSATALKSLAAISNLHLKAGDTVLLAKGSVFTDTLKLSASGKADNPITIGAYGSGDAPTLSGSLGIYGSKASHIVIHDIAIANTTQNAIYAGNATDWTIDHVSISNTGTLSGIGSIVFKSSDGITVKNSTFDHVVGDGIFIQGSSDITIANNRVTNVVGHQADGFQVNDSSKVVLSGNYIDQSTSATSTKGGLIVQNVSDATISNNTLIGGSFGAVANGNNITITDNVISGQDKYSWSSSILIAGPGDFSNYVITGNHISDSNFGVSLTELRDQNFTRSNIDISQNIFTDIIKYALKIDAVSTGSFDDNIIINSKDALIRGDNVANDFSVGNNVALTTEQAATLHAQIAKEVASTSTVGATVEKIAAPVSAFATLGAGAHIDNAALTASSDHVSGNILANDFAQDGSSLALRTVGSSRISAVDSVDIKGAYGTLHISGNGDYSYTLDSHLSLHVDPSAKYVEKFQYKASDGSNVDTSKLVIDVTDYLISHDHLLI